ncbi:hypothetical protein FA15DRAFT_698883 [Coprinopsis marcescibilis]|uniref:REJ domain-containing protein n=1 Tax=Coprinopsis marcescibilis TaxID=230819 RepID=A0A5C3LD79_COPMA|nr:hypothetical protein FA15DRAFT_698883 [Coprinopsis marcescibilis]
MSSEATSSSTFVDLPPQTSTLADSVTFRSESTPLASISSDTQSGPGSLSSQSYTDSGSTASPSVTPPGPGTSSVFSISVSPTVPVESFTSLSSSGSIPFATTASSADPGVTSSASLPTTVPSVSEAPDLSSMSGNPEDSSTGVGSPTSPPATLSPSVSQQPRPPPSNTSSNTSSSSSRSLPGPSAGSGSPTRPQATSTVISVTVVPGRDTGTGTSTLTLVPETTLSEPLTLTLVNSSDGSLLETVPPYVTVLSTSTEPMGGGVVVVTQIVANPQETDTPAAPTSGILQNTGAAAGIFVAVGVVSTVISFFLFMVWRRRRRSEKRKEWFVGMQKQRSNSFGGYAFDGKGNPGGAAATINDAPSPSPYGGMRVEKSVEDDRNLHRWGSIDRGRQTSPPQQHYIPHSSIAAANGSGSHANYDQTLALGLAGIGSGAQYNNGVNPRTGGLPSPTRKPVSTYLYDEELRNIDAFINQNQPPNSDLPTAAVRSRYGLTSINETDANGAVSVPPSSYHFTQQPRHSPVPTSPSLYPPTLGDDEDPFRSAYDDDFDDDAKNLFYQRPALASGVLPPRPPRSRLRESTTSELEGNGGKGSTSSVGSINDLAPPPASAGGKPKIGINVSHLFRRGSDSSTHGGKKPEFIPLTPPSSHGHPSPLHEKHQDILTNRRTLLDVRPRSVRSTASSN